MKLSKLLTYLQELKDEYGDMDVSVMDESLIDFDDWSERIENNEITKINGLVGYQTEHPVSDVAVSSGLTKNKRVIIIGNENGL